MVGGQFDPRPGWSAIRMVCGGGADGLHVHKSVKVLGCCLVQEM
jgi:hypothetical protein